MPAMDLEPPRRDGRRFLLRFALVILLGVLATAVYSRYAFRLMLLPENQTIVQLLDDYARVYKPVLFDQADPEVGVFGASWARDAFEPLASGRATGLDWFNHAVSGATAYEARRFVESSMDARRLRAVILNLDTFLRPDERIRLKRGFDEALLDTDPEGRPTRWLAIERAIATTLSGAAIGNSTVVLDAIRLRAAGADPASYLDSYQRFDFAGREDDIARMREAHAQAAGPAPATPLAELPLPPGARDLERVLALLCRRDIDVYAYFTPSMVLAGGPIRGLAATLHGLDLLRRRQSDCRARLHYYNFNYPNAVTLDGLGAHGRYSLYYRPDGHPRPLLGQLMVTRMFGTPFPDGTPQAVVDDFGVDLLAVPDAEATLRDQAQAMERMMATQAGAPRPAAADG